MNKFAELLLYASTLSGYPYPNETPEIKILPDQEIRDKVGIQTPRAAIYNSETKEIYMMESCRNLPSSTCRSLLVHEYVHYMQDKAGLMYNDCFSWMQNENEAYETQEKYLKNYENENVGTIKRVYCRVK